MASPGEPTQLVQIQKLFQTQLRNEKRRHDSGRASEKRPYAQRLTFDETLNESGNASKLAKISSFNDLSSRRIMNNDNTKVITELEEKNKALVEKLKILTAENAGNLARQAKLENRIKLNEVDMKKSTIEFEHKLEKATRLYKSELDRVNDLKYKLKRVEDTKLDRDDRETETRRQSLDRFEVLESKVKRLRDERNKLEAQNERLETQLRNRADINPIAFSTKMQNYEGSIGELRQKCAEYEERNKLLANRLEAMQQSATENKENKEALARSKLMIEKLECELAANRDSFIQRKAMSQKLDEFSHLEKENQSLRNINELHLKTQENVDLLKEQILNLTAERDRAETRAKDKVVLQADIQTLREEIEEWKDLVTRIATPEERQRIVSCGIQTARNIFKNAQARELDLVVEKRRILGELNDANALIEKGKEILTKKENDLLKVKGEQADQTKLVKKLQRKLLLVSKERDTSRAILDSMEKELTVSGSSWEQSRIEGLEKTLEEYKAMVDMLMEKDTGNSPSGGKSYEDKVAQAQELEKKNQELYRTIKTLEEEIQNKDDVKQSSEQAEILLKEKEELLERVEQLELQLEQRAIKGDFNPDETRVLHFASNPFDNAVKRREVDLEELKAENAALKARIELLEEGQTKDLTMMVGHKLEEGSSSAEVEQLKEKLSSSELKNQRIVELFQKTSKEFRAVIAQTTGFRVDRIKDATYKMIPIYVEKDKYLLFSLSEEDGVQLLETAFSTELEHLMEKHLEQDNSIPMFMASLIRDLFRKQQRDMETETEEERDSQDGEETEHSEGDGVGEGNSEEENEVYSEGEGEIEEEGEGGNNSSDVICVDDD